LFRGIGEVRREASVEYELECVFFTCLLMYLCRLGARQLVSSNLRDGSSEMAGLYSLLFDSEGVPHGDTVNNLLCRVDVDQVQGCVHNMVKSLVRKKVLCNGRLMGKWHMLAIDGTWVMSSRKRHCDHCLTMAHGDKTIYYHPVLEAKIVLPSGLAISVMSEFVENDVPGADKQDCELKALYRLLERLKEAFPQMDFCLLLDGLYPNGEVFQICKDNDWAYIIVLKDDQLGSVQEEYKSLLQLEPANRLNPPREKGSSKTGEYRWASDIAYRDTKGRDHAVHVVECGETDAGKATKFKSITNIKPSKGNVQVLCEAGRCRWKIENEGFNVQKNQGYRLEHAYTRDPNGWKVFYLVLQMATIIEQLLRKSNLLSKELIKSAKSSKNLAAKLLEALRNYTLSVDTYKDLLAQRIQIRIDST
jgi:hypothetical protein